MKDELFDELIQSVKEGGAILHGQKKPSRRFVIPLPDVRLVRDRFGLTQENFAQMLGISLSTLQSWEQGRKKPAGPARLLLQIAAKHPEAVWDTIQKVS